MHKSEGAAEIEKSVGATELDGDHGAGKHDCFAGRYFFGKNAGGIGHGIGAVCDDDAVFFAIIALVHDEVAVFIGHFKAVDHHKGSDLYVEAAAAQLQEIVHVRVLKKQLAIQFIILLIERPPRDENADSHGLLFCLRR